MTLAAAKVAWAQRSTYEGNLDSQNNYLVQTTLALVSFACAKWPFIVLVHHTSLVRVNQRSLNRFPAEEENEVCETGWAMRPSLRNTHIVSRHHCESHGRHQTETIVGEETQAVSVSLRSELRASAGYNPVMTHDAFVAPCGSP